MQEGETGVESTLGQGSTFWFSARLGMPHAAAHEHIDEPGELSGQAGRLHGASILLADDNPLNREVANDILVHAGAVVRVARNGEEALGLLKNNRFDCVLMDIQMPVMDGFGATRLIRLDAELAGIPVIAMTANASKENRERCLASGMDDFISKPFNPEQFYQTIAKWLNREDVKCETGKVKRETGHGEWDEAEDISESQSMNPESGVLDLSVLTDMVGGSKLRMRKMVLKFVKTTRQDMSGMEPTLVRGDYEALRRLAHYVRGPAEMLGAKDFAILCMELGKRCKGEPDAEQVHDVIRQMYAMLNKINEITSCL
jgi:CheY-like chemotaxis protein/HPt (histidine-containing phosphotransfer) domain-containing protein